MAIPVFPTLPGLGWPQGRAPVWSTIVQKSSSGKKTAVQLYTFPEYQYSLDFELLRDFLPFDEFQTLLGFVNSVAAQGSVFYFTDPVDNQVLAQPTGIGDGATASFQLARSLGGFVEPVQSPNAISAVTVSGAAAGAYTLGPKGIITFTSPPAIGAPVAWSGTYYWLCRFDSDTLPFSRTLSGRWEAKGVKFTTEKL